jgi:hypothetical protein
VVAGKSMSTFGKYQYRSAAEVTGWLVLKAPSL